MSSRIELPKDKLIELANRTLNYPASHMSEIPEGYLDELRKHVKFSKDDTLFCIVPHPGYGYGVVLCHEKGCDGLAIPLKGRTSTPDDGKQDGIGSLSAYRVHVQEHSTHKINRLARINAESNNTSSNQSNSDIFTLPDSSSLSTPMDLVITPYNSSTSSLSASVPGMHINPPHTVSSVGSSPSSSSAIITRKRNSVYFEDDDTDITVPSSSPHSPSAVAVKKTKLEVTKTDAFHTPLGTVDSNTPNLTPFKSQTSSVHVNRVQLLNEWIKDAESQLAYFQKRPAVQTPYESNVTQIVEQPLALRSDNYISSVVPPIASGSHVQFSASSSTMEGLPNAPSGYHPSMAPNQYTPYYGLPNYGDTRDSEEEDGPRHGRYTPYGGPIANLDDFQKFIVDVGNSELFDGNESVERALQKIGLKKLGEQLPRMTISLMPHQVIGVAWMREHERGNHKGGILADEMGLGKTVQMISTMALNWSDDPAVKSTLICAPLALLDQWKLEIETKTRGAFKCFIYHGATKPKNLTDLQKYDVVLTTFQTLALEWDDPRAKERKKNNRKKSMGNGPDDFIESDHSEEETKVKKTGLLLRMTWYRVVLDEAQNIRNRNTRISIAVTHLNAKHRWCLTGTPVTNSLADGYGLIRFLGIRPWYDWEKFNEHIARIEKRSPNLATRRMQAIFSSCLLRRKKDSLLDGERLIELPPKKIILQQLQFSADERDIYNAVEAKSQAKFNKYLRAGTVLKNYANILVLLLRLRQLCSHPCLIQEDGDAFVRSEDAAIKHEVQTELDRAAVLAGQDFVKRLKKKFKNVMLQRMAAERESAEAIIEDEECPLCADSLVNPVITRCEHVFCENCIDAVLNQPIMEDSEQPRYAMSERPCPTCQDPIQKEMLFQRAAFEPSDADVQYSGESSSPIVIDGDDEDGLPIASGLLPVVKRPDATAWTKPKSKSKSKARTRFLKRLLESDDNHNDDDDDMSNFIVQSDEDEEEKDARHSEKDIEMEDECSRMLSPNVIVKKRWGAKRLEKFLPSTKMKEMMALLKKWAEAKESRDEKTMVLSQWTSCLDLVADYLDENSFTFVRYQGDMNRLARDEAVRTFMSQGKPRIMLMSLKCGGVGLNLTRANRVISLDLGWSTAVESQAFDRVHRLGQARPVAIHRLVIENTVETRILALQERKQNLADGSLGEGSGRKLGRLSVKDLANLFGLNAQGELL